jgi:hypothetical protein
MCPKAKADQVITHRIEFQETEREALNLVATSIAARNVSQTACNLTKSVNNLLTPFTQASLAGATFAVTIWGLFVVAQEGKKAGIIGADDSGAPITPEDIPPFFFGLIPGSVAYGIRHIKWDNLSSEFDRRMRDYNPPSI